MITIWLAKPQRAYIDAVAPEVDLRRRRRGGGDRKGRRCGEKKLPHRVLLSHIIDQLDNASAAMAFRRGEMFFAGFLWN
jgi:hypothetical protein